MREFTWHVPTEVVFGADSVSHVPALVRKYGGSRVLVVHGMGSVLRSGLLERVCTQLRENGLTVETLGGVQPNPRVALARTGIQKALEERSDFILAIGGGSTIDTAKAIAHGAANPERDIWHDIWLKPSELTVSLPAGAVPTIPAAGSETSDSAVLTDEDSGIKRGLTTQLNRPRFAVLDPALAATLPPYQAACGVTDIMMHTLDRYFNPFTDNEITDEFAEGLLRVVIRNGREVVKDPGNLHAMSEIYWCGSLSHNGLTGLGGKKDFAPHQFSQALGAKFDKAHGACLAAIWGAWARYVCQTDIARFARYARNVWGAGGGIPDNEAALLGINASVDYFRSLGMPADLTELVGKQEEAVIDELADLCSFQRTRTIGTFRVLDRDDMRSIFAAANCGADDNLKRSDHHG